MTEEPIEWVARFDPDQFEATPPGALLTVAPRDGFAVVRCYQERGGPPGRRRDCFADLDVRPPRRGAIITREAQRIAATIYHAWRRAHAPPEEDT
jgi:hypothetical protein